MWLYTGRRICERARSRVSGTTEKLLVSWRIDSLSWLDDADDNDPDTNDGSGNNTNINNNDHT